MDLLTIRSGRRSFRSRKWPRRQGSPWGEGGESNPRPCTFALAYWIRSGDLTTEALIVFLKETASTRGVSGAEFGVDSREA